METTSNEINPPGKRPPLHRQVSPRAALAWWIAHRYDELGQQWLERVGATPAQVAQLDAWLLHASQATMPQAAAPEAPEGKQEVPTTQPNETSFLFRRALQREQANEGPPIGAEVA